MVGKGRVANIAVSLSVGDLDGVLLGGGLTNPSDAEIHIVVRTHGPMIPSLVSDQILTVHEACDVNTCQDLQAAAFEP